MRAVVNKRYSAEGAADAEELRINAFPYEGAVGSWGAGVRHGGITARFWRRSYNFILIQFNIQYNTVFVSWRAEPGVSCNICDHAFRC